MRIAAHAWIRAPLLVQRLEREEAPAVRDDDVAARRMALEPVADGPRHAGRREDSRVLAHAPRAAVLEVRLELLAVDEPLEPQSGVEQSRRPRNLRARPGEDEPGADVDDERGVVAQVPVVPEGLEPTVGSDGLVEAKKAPLEGSALAVWLEELLHGAAGRGALLIREQRIHELQVEGARLLERRRGEALELRLEAEHAPAGARQALAASAASRLGVSESSRFVYSARGESSTSSTSPRSTIRPALMTATSWESVRMRARL